MVDISRPWVIDSPLSERYPVYTRANVGEVSPDVATPLFWSMIGGPPSERVWKQALVDFGAFDADEFRDDVIDIQGMLHGYVYLNLSNLRVFGVRMPGASAELMDRTYLGDADAPPYEPHPDDDAPQFTERILASVERVFATESRPDLDEAAIRAAELRAARPDLSAMSDAEVLAHQRHVMNVDYPPFLHTHLTLVYESSLVTGLLEQALAPLEDPSLSVRLMSGLGNIASARPTIELWKLSRQIVASPALTTAFDEGLDGLLARLRDLDEPTVVDFVDAWDRFTYEFGSRSANEWEAHPETWETHPHLPLSLVDRMRLQPDDRAPELQSARLREERAQLTTEVRERLADDAEAQGQLDLALKLIGVYLPVRELSKTNTIRVLHEARLAMRELGLRYVDAGHFDTVEDITMVREDELDALIADPVSFRDTIAERWEWRRQLQQLDPPFIVDSRDVPPVTTWPEKREPAVNVGRPGDVLTGLPACPGTATGPARIINDPTEASDLEPGEILVAPMTDPGWTPLFTSAAAVVVNIGSSLSHAAIVSRELGIPCVLGVKHATKRISNGTMLTVDGTAGTVTIQ